MLNDKIDFPKAKDMFETVRDVSSSGAFSADTVLYAERFNKIKNFIVKVEPLINLRSNSGGDNVSTDGTFIGFTYTFSWEASIAGLLNTFYKGAFDVGKTPPTHFLPFEFVLTSSFAKNGWQGWPVYKSQTPGLEKYSSSSSLWASIGINASPEKFPLISCSLSKSNPDSATFLPNWIVNWHGVVSKDTSNNPTLIVRGVILALDKVSFQPTQNTLVDLDNIWPSSEDIILNTTITGVF